jgi:lipopolysaccharide/colanic/teichoic acid biosynthesis glycosyltransferase
MLDLGVVLIVVGVVALEAPTRDHVQDPLEPARFGALCGCIALLAVTAYAVRLHDTQDRRITSFGRFRRATHVDELPQVLNVLLSHSTIVGPHPPSPGHAGDPAGARTKLQYDLYYVHIQSLSLDLSIIARTTRTVVGCQGR